MRANILYNLTPLVCVCVCVCFIVSKGSLVCTCLALAQRLTQGKKVPPLSLSPLSARYPNPYVSLLTEVIIDTACQFSGHKSIVPIAFRTHAHSHSTSDTLQGLVPHSFTHYGMFRLCYECTLTGIENTFHPPTITLEICQTR